MLASSSRRDQTADKSGRQSKKVGCMSGIFYLLHFHRHHSRKRLPSPGTRDNKTTVSTAPAPTLPTQPEPKAPAAAAAAEPGQKTPRKKRASRQQVPSPASAAAAKPPAGDKSSSNSKRSAPHEAAAPPPPAAAAGPGGKTSHNKRAAPRPEAATPGKTSHDKQAAPVRTYQAPASPPAAGGSPGGGLSRRLSCDVPRSPTLSSEIRRLNSAGNAAARKPPALVARLMGLDDPPPPPLPPVDCSPESAAEKRRKLLGALERCDEDLRTLKNIIEALRVAEKAPTAGRQLATPKRSDSGHGAGAVEDKRCLDVEGEQPSPVSVLDALFSPPARRRFNNGGAAAMAKGGNQRGEAAPPAVRSKQQPCPVFAPLPQPGRHDKEAKVANGQSPLFHRDAIPEALPRGGAAAGRTAERPFLETSYYSEVLRQRRGTTTSHPWLQRLQNCSRAMEESVDQVWKDGAREERWELGSVAVALEADVLGDLVAELVRELGFRRRYCSSSRLPQLPFDACRKRLCYY